MEPQSIIDTGESNISLPNMIRLGGIDTFKTIGFVNKNKLLVMVHPRSTLNIFDKGQIKWLGLYVDTRERFPISVLGKMKIMCTGVVHNVELKLGEYIIKDSFFVIKVGGVDAILRVWWLIKLGTHG